MKKEILYNVVYLQTKARGFPDMKNFDFIKKKIYIKYLSRSCFFGVTPMIVGLERCAKNKKPVESLKEHYALHYVYEGKGIVTVNGKDYKLSENSFFLLSPKARVTYRPDPEQPWQYAWIEFFGIDANTILETIRLEDFVVFFSSQREFFNDLFVDILKSSRQENLSSFLKITSLLLTVLQGLIDESERNIDLQKSAQFQKLLPVIEYINKHYCESECTPQSIAKNFGYTLSYFSRVFRRNFKQPISSYIIQLRINQACMLLKHTELSVSDIAYMIGYSSPFYFSTQFRKMKDYSPTDYRKMGKDEN